MSEYDYDLFVIGGGSGGIRAAHWSASLGAKVALCEKDRLGGTCVIRGCIPKKMMVYASSFNKNFKLAKDYGWQISSPSLNWEEFIHNKDQEIHRLETIYQGILKKNKVDFLYGHGKIVGPHSVELKGKKYTARFILIAVGGQPYRLSIKGENHCLSSDEIFHLKKPARSLLVLGAGYIGLEFASIFNTLGSKVSVMFRKDWILSGFDQAVREHLQKELSQQGLKMLANRSPVEVKKEKESLVVKDNTGALWKGDCVLMALGRIANLEGLNLSSAGVQTEGRYIVVNDFFQTSCPSIYAVGDCITKGYRLTPVALNSGLYLSEFLFGKNKKVFEFQNIPSAIFTQPEVAVVGLSEEQALRDGYEVKVYETQFRALKLSLTGCKEKSYMKWVVCKKTDVLLGCHIVAENAGEILQGFAVAVKNRLTKAQLDQTVGIHPTSAEELVTMRSSRK
ncbi:MAG: glutathione-disulfide reductase [Bdellovibrionales bacterium]|nr:glutathione-disulfide reductase [Bdellovibrionales bacterium]